MYKLIIIDDEEEIRNGLKFFVNTTQPDYEIVGEFEDGREAIEFLKENSVDLVITDIKMTNVTGLDIMKFVYENSPETKVIVISGYMDFNYSAKAIEYKARYYITKPTKYKELTAIFATVTEELNENYENKRKEEQYLMKYEFFKNDFLKAVFSNDMSKEAFSEKLTLIDEDGALKNSSFIIIGMGIADYEEYCIQKWKIGIEQFYLKIINFVSDFFKEYNLNCTSPYHVRGKFKFIIYTDAFSEIEEFIEFSLEKIKELNYRSGFNLDIKIKAHISKAYENIYNFFENDSVNMERFGNEDGQTNQQKLDRIKEYIFANITSDVSLQQVADHFHYNLKYFSYYFKQQSGENFSSYVTNLRMNMAKELLKNTNEKLTDIAGKVGYNDLSYFLKMFKKQTGLSPLEYRQKVKNNDEY